MEVRAKSVRIFLLRCLECSDVRAQEHSHAPWATPKPGDTARGLTVANINLARSDPGEDRGRCQIHTYAYDLNNKVPRLRLRSGKLRRRDHHQLL